MIDFISNINIMFKDLTTKKIFRTVVNSGRIFGTVWLWEHAGG